MRSEQPRSTAPSATKSSLATGGSATGKAGSASVRRRSVRHPSDTIDTIRAASRAAPPVQSDNKSSRSAPGVHCKDCGTQDDVMLTVGLRSCRACDTKQVVHVSVSAAASVRFDLKPLQFGHPLLPGPQLTRCGPEAHRAYRGASRLWSFSMQHLAPQ